MERERRSLAADVHDGLAQDLAVALRELALLDEPGRRRGRGAREPRAPARRRSPTRTGIVRSRLEDLRGPVPLGGLRAAVETTVERFERGGLAVRLTVRGAAPTSARRRSSSSRACSARRSPNVVAARARATRRPSSCASRASGSSSLVDDDGDGLRRRAARRGRGDGHFGLAIMRERARGCGGECEIGPRPGGGTRVALRMPVA